MGNCHTVGPNQALVVSGQCLRKRERERGVDFIIYSCRSAAMQTKGFGSDELFVVCSFGFVRFLKSYSYWSTSQLSFSELFYINKNNFQLRFSSVVLIGAWNHGDFWQLRGVLKYTSVTRPLYCKQKPWWNSSVLYIKVQALNLRKKSHFSRAQYYCITGYNFSWLVNTAVECFIWILYEDLKMTCIGCRPFFKYCWHLCIISWLPSLYLVINFESIYFIIHAPLKDIFL